MNTLDCSRKRLSRITGIVTMTMLAAILVSACGVKDKPGLTDKNAPKKYSAEVIQQAEKKLKEPDYWPTSGWKTTTPEQQGMDSNQLAELYENMDGKKVDSMLVVRNGYLIAEGYSKDYAADTTHNIFSVTKSVLSALIGIAINEKKMPDITSKAADYFPYPEIKTDAQKKEITIEDFLTMTPGLKWDNQDENSTNEMAASDDWVKYVWDQPVIADNGKSFLYSNGNPHVLSALLQSQIGETAYEYAKEKLFTPLGITNTSWKTDNRGIQIGAYSLNLTPRDMAKFGFLYLHGGKWEDKQVVPESWVKNSITDQVNFTYVDGTIGGYGYLWWLKPIEYQTGTEKITLNSFYAAGSGNQRIFVVPELNLEVVFTGNNDKDALQTERLMQMIVQYAYNSNKPLPGNQAATDRLNKAIKDFKTISTK
jgi:CubicO group peptidase (beta-lactamase class C family)